MGYVDDNLISGESVQYRGSLHWNVLALPVLFATAFLAVGLWMVLGPLARPEGYTGHGPMVVSGLVLLVIGAVPPAYVGLWRRSAEFAVTNKRVIFKIGMIRRRTAEMFLTKIESIGVDQGVLGRMLNYGSIVVRGTGGTYETFPGISAPMEFRRQVQEQVGKLA